MFVNGVVLQLLLITTIVGIKFFWISLGFLSLKIYMYALHSVLGIIFAAPGF